MPMEKSTREYLDATKKCCGQPPIPLAAKRKWVKALRSGEYKQGAGRLYQNDYDGVDKYCCLGVAFNALDAWIEKVERSYLSLDVFNDLPQIGGMEAPSVLNLRREMRGALANANDNTIPGDHIRIRAATFKELADWIEKNL